MENSEISIYASSLSVEAANQSKQELLDRYSKKTPKKFLKDRQGKGGQTWTYVDRRYVEQWLNKTYGTRWSFEIVYPSVQTIGDHIHVVGRLTVIENDGSIRKIESYGSKEAIPSNGKLTSHPYLKSAESDAIKRCAAMLGCASDVYKAETIDTSIPSDIIIDPEIIVWFVNAMRIITKSLPPEKLINLPKQFTALAEGKITKESIIANYGKLGIEL